MKLKKGLAMQVSIDVQDDLYEKVLNSGIDMQSEFNDYLRRQIEENSYQDSKQFQENRAYFHKIYKEIENGEATLTPLDEGWDTLNDFIDKV